MRAKMSVKMANGGGKGSCRSVHVTHSRKPRPQHGLLPPARQISQLCNRKHLCNKHLPAIGYLVCYTYPDASREVAKELQSSSRGCGIVVTCSSATPPSRMPEA